MRQSISFYQSYIDVSQKTGIIFLKYLMDSYLAEVDDTRTPKYKPFTFRIYKPDQFEQSNVVYIGNITFCLIAADVPDWLPFKKWCMTKDVEINVKKKSIGRTKEWWPGIIEIIVDDKNEWLFLSKIIDDIEDI